MAERRWLHILAAMALLLGITAWFIPLPQGEAASPTIRLKRLTFTDTPTMAPSPTPTDTPEATATPTESPSPTPSPTPETQRAYLPIIFKHTEDIGTPTVGPTDSPRPATPTNTATPPTPSATPTESPSPTWTPLPDTPTPSETPVPETSTPTPSDTPKPPTPTPSASPTAIPPTHTSTTTPTPGCGEIIVNGDFEQGREAWIEESSGGYAIITTEWSDPYQGSWVAWFGGYNNADDKIYQLVSVPPNAQDNQILVFYLYVESDDSPVNVYDEFFLQFFNSSWDPVSDPIWIADNTTPMDWTLQSINLSGFSSIAGQDIYIRFKGTTDYSLITNFVIDEVSLDIACGAGAPGPRGIPHIAPSR
jgi:hypothetical protein